MTNHVNTTDLFALAARWRGMNGADLPPYHPLIGGSPSNGRYYLNRLADELDAALASMQPSLAGQGDEHIDLADPWRGLYKAERLPAPTEYGDITHPDLPCWPDDREDALDKLVHAQGFDFQTVAGEFTESAMDEGDELYWQEMRAWNPEAPDGDWRLAWKGDTEDGPYAWFVLPMALRPDLEALAARQSATEQHPDDLAVDAFAEAMKAKMAAARAKGRGGWEDPVQCTADDLSRMLRDHVEKGDPRDVANFCMMLHQRGEAIAARQPVGQTFQAGVAERMGQCFLPSLYSNMTERGDRLLEEVLELLQAHDYDSARVPTLVDYVFGRPVGEPAQEVGGVMVTLAGYCWVAGIDMHAAGDAELDRINQPDVMAKIRAKQEAKNALHFDTPLPGNPGSAVDEWPHEGDLVRYGTGASALAIRLGPHAGGWHGYQCCGGYTFFTKAYRPSRADMDTWLDCAKYRDDRTKAADNRVAHEMYLIDSGKAVQT